MACTWNYVIKVKDEAAFADFEQTYKVAIPKALRELVAEANAGTPSKVRIRDEKGNERVFGALLSYNKEDTDSVFGAMKHARHDKYLPFAVDPFGNYFSINTLRGDIVWEDHETNGMAHIADSLDSMLERLY